MSTKLLALDGHDGAGKTTLAVQLAERVGGRYVRPFAGASGAALLQAYQHGEPERVIEVGTQAIRESTASSNGEPLVLDRGWLTVSTLVPQALFAARWQMWVPSVLLWCDLPTTLQRLGKREYEAPEPAPWHEEFLALYLQRRALRDGPVLRTDLLATDDCLDRLTAFYAGLPPFAPDAEAARERPCVKSRGAADK